MTEMTTESAQSSKTEQVKERVEEGAQQIQEKASEMKGQTRGRLSQQLDTRSTQAGERMTSTASALRQTAEKLRDDNDEQQANVLEQIAERIERLGGYLSEANGDRFLQDVEGFARRRPWLIAVGSTTLGFLAARFVKASSSTRYEADGSGTARYPTTQRQYTPALPRGSAVRGRGGDTSDDL